MASQFEAGQVFQVGQGNGASIEASWLAQQFLAGKMTWIGQSHDVARCAPSRASDRRPKTGSEGQINHVTIGPEKGDREQGLSARSDRRGEQNEYLI